jgi:hypothetical protein
LGNPIRSLLHGFTHPMAPPRTTAAVPRMLTAGADVANAASSAQHSSGGRLRRGGQDGRILMHTGRICQSWCVGEVQERRCMSVSEVDPGRHEHERGKWESDVGQHGRPSVCVRREPGGGDGPVQEENERRVWWPMADVLSRTITTDFKLVIKIRA